MATKNRLQAQVDWRRHAPIGDAPIGDTHFRSGDQQGHLLQAGKANS